jgi:hypothetical protein
LEAVAHELAHHPRRCAVCRPPQMSREARLLLTAFGAQDRGKLGKFKQGALLASRLGVALVRRRLAQTGAL